MRPDTHRIRPTPIDHYLGNPHKGLCTFQHFNGDALYPGNFWSEEGPLVDEEEDRLHLEELQKVYQHHKI